jgi:hypothetical protein
MIVNFKTRRISQDKYKLTRTPVLIIIKKLIREGMDRANVSSRKH